MTTEQSYVDHVRRVERDLPACLSLSWSHDGDAWVWPELDVHGLPTARARKALDLRRRRGLIGRTERDSRDGSLCALVLSPPVRS